MIVDFHMHTTVSDGRLSPVELMALIRSAGIDYFSITDHDTMAAYEQNDAAFAPLARRLVPGMEISSHADGKDAHILAYNVSTDASDLARALGDRPAARHARMGKIIEKLAAAGIALSMGDIEEQAQGDVIGRAHIARALVTRGFARDADDAFARYLGTAGAAYVPATSLTPHAAVRAIGASGGVAVMAHPSRGGANTFIPELVDCGLAGIEAYYAAHSRLEAAHYRDLAKKLGLVVTAGSDFHEASRTQLHPGCDVDDEIIRPFLNLVL